MIKICALILNWNGLIDTRLCLKSLSLLNRQNILLTTVVIDNASTDNSVKNIGKEFPEVKIIENKKNLGFAEGNNIGIKESDSDYLLILNNDTVADKNLLVNLLDCAGKYKLDMLSPKIYFMKGREFHKIYKDKDLGKVIWYAGGHIDWRNVIGSHSGVDEVDKGQFDQAQETDFLTGACMFVKREVFEKIGLFDPIYYLYYEDMDLCQRAKRSGFKLGFCPKAVIWHKNAGNLGSGSTLQDYYITRNRIIFGFKYAPLKSKLALVKESINLLLKGRKWQKRGISDFYLNKWSKGSYE